MQSRGLSFIIVFFNLFPDTVGLVLVDEGLIAPEAKINALLNKFIYKK